MSLWEFAQSVVSEEELLKIKSLKLVRNCKLEDLTIEELISIQEALGISTYAQFCINLLKVVRNNKQL